MPAPPQNRGEPPRQRCQYTASQPAGCQPVLLAVLGVSGPSSCSDQNDPCCHCRQSGQIRSAHASQPALRREACKEPELASSADRFRGFWMGQCQKTDRPSCILELWFPELFPGMKTQHRPSQISTLVPRHAHGSSESAVAPLVSLVFMFPRYSPSFSNTPESSVGLWIHAPLLQSCRIPQAPRKEPASPPSFLGVPWGLVLRDKGVWQWNHSTWISPPVPAVAGPAGCTMISSTSCTAFPAVPNSTQDSNKRHLAHCPGLTPASSQTPAATHSPTSGVTDRTGRVKAGELMG